MKSPNFPNPPKGTRTVALTNSEKTALVDEKDFEWVNTFVVATNAKGYRPHL